MPDAGADRRDTFVDRHRRRRCADAPINTRGEVGTTGKQAKRPIARYGRHSATGTCGFFKDVALFGGDYRPEGREPPGSSTVIQGVASDIAGIGYAGVAYGTPDVRAVPLRGPRGNCYGPTGEAASASDYPIAPLL